MCCVFTATNLSTQEPFARLRRPKLLSNSGELFLPQDFRTSLREVERFQMLKRFSRRLQLMISSVRPPTCTRVGAHISPDRFFVSSHSCRTPLSQRCHRQCRPSIFRHARVFGQTVEQSLTVRDHSDGQVLLLPFVFAQHCSRVICQVKSNST